VPLSFRAIRLLETQFLTDSEEFKYFVQLVTVEFEIPHPGGSSNATRSEKETEGRGGISIDVHVLLHCCLAGSTIRSLPDWTVAILATADDKNMAASRMAEVLFNQRLSSVVGAMLDSGLGSRPSV
jgi:hypothetical protein